MCTFIAHVETDTAVMKDLPDRKTEHRYDRIKTRGIFPNH